MVSNQTITLPSLDFTVVAYDRSILEGELQDDPSIQLYGPRRIDLSVIPGANPNDPDALLKLRHLAPTPVGYRTFRLDQRNDALLRQIEELENGDYCTFITGEDNQLGIVPKVDGMVAGPALGARLHPPDAAVQDRLVPRFGAAVGAPRSRRAFGDTGAGERGLHRCAR